MPTSTRQLNCLNVLVNLNRVCARNRDFFWKSSPQSIYMKRDNESSITSPNQKLSEAFANED